MTLPRPTLTASLMTLAAATSVIVPLGAQAATTGPAARASGSTYRHGSYAQAHWGTSAQCESARTAATKAISTYGGTSISAGLCHEISAGAGKTRQTGWMYDLTYRRSNALWYGDVKLGAGAVTKLAGAHSFKSNGVWSTKADAVKHEAERVAALKTAAFGAKVTWRSGVKQNAVTKKFEYEIDYDSRVPFTATNTQISEKPGVTSPAIGVVDPIPTVPVPDPTKPPVVVTPPPVVVTPPEATSVPGLDISGHTVLADWEGWKKAGFTFAYIKASEGNYYLNDKFSSQYTGASNAGVLRGAYHFANPSVATGAEQADYFVAHGGGWSADGTTLPGALDMEWNPYGPMCFDMTTGQMRTWINDFVTEYRTRTGVSPMIYTASIWWNKCVGTDMTNTGAPMSATAAPETTVTDAMLTANPLWIADYNTPLGALPAAWTNAQKTQAIWQNSEVNAKGYDTNIFNGTPTQLKAYVTTGRR